MVKGARVLVILLICFALASCSTLFQTKRSPEYQEGKFVVSFPVDGDIVTTQEGDQYYVVTSKEFEKILEEVAKQQEKTRVVEVTQKEVREIRDPN